MAYYGCGPTVAFRNLLAEKYAVIQAVKNSKAAGPKLPRKSEEK